MYSYSLQYFRQLDNSTRHRPNITSCTRFRKDLDFYFFCGVPFLFSVWAWYMQKLAATSQIIDIDTTTPFVSHMVD